jgi:hypothetical protein
MPTPNAPIYLIQGQEGGQILCNTVLHTDQVAASSAPTLMLRRPPSSTAAAAATAGLRRRYRLKSRFMQFALRGIWQILAHFLSAFSSSLDRVHQRLLRLYKEAVEASLFEASVGARTSEKTYKPFAGHWITKEGSVRFAGQRGHRGHRGRIIIG